MSMVVFFPWLRLAQSLIADDFTLIPYERGSLPAGGGTALQDILDVITEPYLVQAGQPIRYATLVQVGQGEISRDLDELQRGAAFVFSEI